MKTQVISTVSETVTLMRSRRTQLGITQRELATFCDLSHNGISKLEGGGGDVKLSTLLKMSKILGFKIVIEMEE